MENNAEQLIAGEADLTNLDLATAVEELSAYGTSEGVMKEWDERGRGRKGADGLIDSNGWLTPDGVFHPNIDARESHGPAAVRLGIGGKDVPHAYERALKYGNVRISSGRNDMKPSERGVTTFEAVYTPATNSLIRSALERVTTPNVVIDFNPFRGTATAWKFTDIITVAQARHYLSTGELPSNVARFHVHDLDSAIAELEAYGTSEGAIKGWDTRGRGRKAAPEAEKPPEHSTQEVHHDDQVTLEDFYARLNSERAQFVIAKGEAMVAQVIARNPGLKEKSDAVASLQAEVQKYDDADKVIGQWFNDYWQLPPEERDATAFKEHEAASEENMRKSSEVYNQKLELNRSFSEDLVRELRMEGHPDGNIEMNTTVPGEHGPLDMLTGTSTSPLSRADFVKGAVNSFAKFTGASGRVNVFTCIGSRASYSDNAAFRQTGSAVGNSFPTVWLPEGTNTGTIWHELGHWIEDTTPGGHLAAQAFLAMRTKGEETKPLAELTHSPGYGEWEKAKPDKFDSAYTGKIYGDGSTEIVSMGMQRMQEDPAQFYRFDREHFNFTLGMIKARQEGGFAW